MAFQQIKSPSPSSRGVFVVGRLAFLGPPPRKSQIFEFEARGWHPPTVLAVLRYTRTMVGRWDLKPFLDTRVGSTPAGASRRIRTKSPIMIYVYRGVHIIYSRFKSNRARCAIFLVNSYSDIIPEGPDVISKIS